MIVKATITEKTVRNVEIEIPDGEYTDEELHKSASTGELLLCGDIIGEQLEISNELTNIEIDSIERSK